MYPELGLLSSLNRLSENKLFGTFSFNEHIILLNSQTVLQISSFLYIQSYNQSTQISGRFNNFTATIPENTPNQQGENVPEIHLRHSTEVLRPGTNAVSILVCPSCFFPQGLCW